MIKFVAVCFDSVLCPCVYLKLEIHRQNILLVLGDIVCKHMWLFFVIT